MAKRNTLGAAKYFLTTRQVESAIRMSSINASLGGIFREILGCEKRIAVFVPSRSRCQKLPDEREVGFGLVWNERAIFT